MLGVNSHVAKPGSGGEYVPGKYKKIMNKYLTWIEIDLNAIRHNFRVLRKLAGTAKILTVIKADAYGHGMLPIAEAVDPRRRWIFIGLSNLTERDRLTQGRHQNAGPFYLKRLWPSKPKISLTSS